jgi:pullulanase/glycogen debranching enzyme
MNIKVWPGKPYPLGATYDGMGTNFSLFSEVAERVELCLFDENGQETRVDLPEVSFSAGMDTCRKRSRANVTATGSTVHGRRSTEAGATRTSSSWTLMPRRWKDKWTGTRPSSPIVSQILKGPLTRMTAHPLFQGAW